MVKVNPDMERIEETKDIIRWARINKILTLTGNTYTCFCRENEFHSKRDIINHLFSCHAPMFDPELVKKYRKPKKPNKKKYIVVRLKDRNQWRKEMGLSGEKK